MDGRVITRQFMAHFGNTLIIPPEQGSPINVGFMCLKHELLEFVVYSFQFQCHSRFGATLLVPQRKTIMLLTTIQAKVYSAGLPNWLASQAVPIGNQIVNLVNFMATSSNKLQNGIPSSRVLCITLDKLSLLFSNGIIMAVHKFTGTNIDQLYGDN